MIIFKMKMVLVFCASFNFIFGRPQNSVQTDVVEQSFNMTELGSFSYSFSTSDGFHHEAKGEIKNVGTSEEGLSVKGAYYYISPDGNVYSVQYTADDKGFRPVIRILPASGPRAGESCVASICGTGLG